MRFFAALFGGLLLASCGDSDYSRCPPKLTKLSGKSFDFADGTRISPTDFDKHFAKSVIDCNPNFTYANLQNPLQLEYVLKLPDGQRLLILGMLFVADVKVVIQLDPSGEVEDTFITGMTGVIGVTEKSPHYSI